jgi:hypothetical protein
VALQTGFADSNVGYNAAATGNCQTAGMPYKSASDSSYPQRPPQQAQAQQQTGTGSQFGGAQHYQNPSQYGAQGYTQISSTTSCYPEGSSGNNSNGAAPGAANAAAATATTAAGGGTNKDAALGVTDQELQALLSQKDIATSLAEDLLKHFGSEDLEVKEEPHQSATNNGTLSSGPFSPSNLDASSEKIKEVKVRLDPSPIRASNSLTLLFPLQVPTLQKIHAYAMLAFASLNPARRFNFLPRDILLNSIDYESL